MKMPWRMLVKRIRIGSMVCGAIVLAYLVAMICSSRLIGPICWITYIPFAKNHYFQKRVLEYKTGFALWIDERKLLNGDAAFYYDVHSQVFKLDATDIACLQEIISELLELNEHDESVPYRPLGLQLGFYESRIKDGIRVELDINAYGYRLAYHAHYKTWPLVAGRHTEKTWALWEKYSEHHVWREFSSIEKEWILNQRAHHAALKDVEGDLFALRNVIGDDPTDTGTGMFSTTTLYWWDYDYQKK